jgi:hypothetical protein
MAKVGLVAKHLSPEVLSLAKALSSQKEDVLIITSQNTVLPDSLEFPVITPFENWSVMETLRLFPRLLPQMPDVLHFVYATPDEVPTGGDWLLAKLLQPFPRKAVLASFFYSPEKGSRWLSAFLHACHGVSWGSHIHLLQARRAGLVSEWLATEVIPPFWTPDIDPQAPVTQELQELTEKIEPFIFVPGSAADFFKNARREELFFDQPVNFLFLGKRKIQNQKLSNCYFLEQDNLQNCKFVSEKAQAVLLAFNDFTLSELQRNWVWSQTLGVPLLVNYQQNEVFPGLVNEGKTGWVLGKDEESLRTLVRDGFKRPGLKSKPSNLPFPIFDSASNQLARLLNRALTART